jgi:RNA polymerase sigma factor (sigma-70 family)
VKRPVATADQLAMRAGEFETVFAAHWPAVCRFLRSRGAGTATEDLAAETFALAWRAWRRTPEQPLPWLLRTARHHLANHRRLARHTDLPLLDRDASAAAGDPANEDRDELATLLTALAALSDADREAVLLVSWDGLSTAQAATVLGCSAPAFRVRRHRALARLHVRLETSDGGFATSLPTPNPVPRHA